MNSFFSKQELIHIGFKFIGENVLISKKASIYNPKGIEIGNNVRIDDFCILSGNIKIHNNVHISAFCGLYGGEFGIEIMDFSGVSPNSMVFAISDDFSKSCLIGPMVDKKYRNIIGGKVTIEKYAQIGSGSVIMPSVTISEGSVIGALSFVKKSTNSWGVYVGSPAVKLKDRNKISDSIKNEFILSNHSKDD